MLELDRMNKNLDITSSLFDRQEKRFEEMKIKRTNQRLAKPQHQAQQQPRLTKDADAETYIKTRKRTEGAAADGVKHGDTSFARVDHEPMRQTSFGEKTAPNPQLFLYAEMMLRSTKASKRRSRLPTGEMRT